MNTSIKRSKIARILATDAPDQDEVLIKGWVRTRRDAKGFSFLEVNDGSCLKNIQVVADEDLANYEAIAHLTTGSAVAVTGYLVASPGAGQKWEIKAIAVEIVSLAPEAYPLQKKRHSDEFLRTIAHLRPRTNKYGAAFRIRSELSLAIHNFFRDRGFYYIHTPIITGSDCEGAGELFQVTTLDLKQVPMERDRVDFRQDFFGREARLTVSGQLAVEMFALALGDVYTFGPTFRAENSNTRRHAAEFWMVEPEMAFCDLEGDMDLAEALIREVTSQVMATCAPDIELFARFVDKSLASRLAKVTDHEFVRLPYAEAIRILERAAKKFQYKPEFGADLQSEHEQYLTETHFQKPIIVFDYPRAIKPFYMRVNANETTVAAMDVLIPGVGELVGGSQREERLDVLESRMDETGMDKTDYAWYLDSRRFGSVPHAGFGLGFERFLMFLTGIANIRDVIPFPRTPGAIEF